VPGKDGGHLAAKDFDPIEAEWVAPIRAADRGPFLLELPPNGQGIVALTALGILEGFDLPGLFREDEARASDLILEAIKPCFADAERYVAGPRFAQTPLARLLSAEYLAARRAPRPDPTTRSTIQAGRVHGDTTYLTVVDRERNAVSLITSISDVFGSGIIVPGTGIVLHDRGADFTMDPAHPNHAAPGKRVPHTILPAMMLAPDGSLQLRFGCMGANMQPQGQVQIVVNILDRGMNLQQAIDAPRVRALDGRRISVEPHPGSDLAGALAALGHEIVTGEEVPADWMAPHDFMRSFEGSAQAIAIGDSTLSGASDPRLDGIAVAW
jgi:gamma-glutamyltranspeptidase / glutathione hydrolase